MLRTYSLDLRTRVLNDCLADPPDLTLVERCEKPSPTHENHLKKTLCAAEQDREDVADKRAH